MNPNRRQFLFKTAQSIGTFGLIAGAVRAGAMPSCDLTPDQTPGPFYPGESAFNVLTDLTHLPNSATRALGQVIYITGVVQDESCNPISGATIEIWQACSTGRYNNPNDTNPAALDPNFLYWGEVSTDSSGQFSFKSVKPGAYPADVNWMRPPHVHFKISKLGYHELITQMYFDGESLNNQDQILQALSAQDQERVIIDFAPVSATSGLELGALVGKFPISLNKVKR